MVQKNFVGQNCKVEVFGLSKIVDDFGCSILHHLMEKILFIKIRLIFGIVFVIIVFILLKKWVISTLFL